jgi:hypothetical protein
MEKNNNEEKSITHEVHPTNELKFFPSFEEENEYTAMQCAAKSFDDRMLEIETLRKRVFRKFLLPDNTWPPISKTFKILPPNTNETRQ